MGALVDEPKTGVDRACHRLVLQGVGFQSSASLPPFPPPLGKPPNRSVTTSMHPRTVITPSPAARRPRREAKSAIHQCPIVTVLFVRLDVFECDETDRAEY